MPSINEIIERVERVKPCDYDDETKAAWLMELDGKLWAEAILRHRASVGSGLRGAVGVCPKCESADGLEYNSRLDANRCTACGWNDLPDIPRVFPEDGDKPLLVKAPYDNVYDMYLMAMIDLHRHEIANYNNSMALYNTALDEWKKQYHRTHEPLGVSGWAL